jgi:hypothetical protein
MKSNKGRILLLGVTVAAIVSTLGKVGVMATPSPTGSPGQPGAFNGTTCATYTVTPGNSVNSTGSPFNPIGQAGLVYAGNPGTASLLHSNSIHPVSEYDAACFQQTVHGH